MLITNKLKQHTCSLEVNLNILKLVLSWSGFCHTHHFHGNDHSSVLFVFECHVINYLLT